ncbi:MAG: hypothetical protein KDM91_06845, partial [Verrucomicrobiae bacterium]|nr:hypothetical protein [Verrucomicrobiae bacterium]
MTSLLLAPMARAFSPEVKKVHGRATNGQAGNRFGGVISMSGGFVAIGQPEDDDVADNAGAVQLFNGKAASYARKFKAPDGEADDRFGCSVAVLGNLLVIGAKGDDDAGADAGAVYVYANHTAKLLAKLTASDAGAGDEFGTSVALTHNRLIVGCPKGYHGATDSGAVYVFECTVYGGNPSVGAELRKIGATDGGTDDLFGQSVAACDRYLAVGAPADADNGADSGSAYVFDLHTGTQLWKLTPADGGAGHLYGSSLSVDRDQVLVGAPMATDGSAATGAAYLHSAGTGLQLQKLIPTGGAAGDLFGTSVSLAGHLALVGSPEYDDGARVDSGAAWLYELPMGSLVGMLIPGDNRAGDGLGRAVCLMDNFAMIGADLDDDNGADSGSAYTYDDVNGKFPLRMLVKLGDYAPEVVNGQITKVGDATVNQSSESLLEAAMRNLENSLKSLTQTGAPPPPSLPKNATGIWTDQGGDVNSVLRTLDVLPGGETIKSVGNPIFNSPLSGVFQAVMATSSSVGVNKTNNQAVFSVSPVTVAPVIRTGTPVAALGDAAIAGVKQMVQARSTVNDGVGIAYTLRSGTGTTTTVNRTNDSGAMVLSSAGAVINAVAREGNPVPNSLGAFFAQNFGRISLPPTGGIATASFLTGFGPKPVTAVMTKEPMADWVTAFFQNHPAIGLPFGTQIGTPFGETLNATNTLIYRTSLTGAKGSGVTSKNNEVLYFGADPVAREGDAPDPAEPAVVFSRILKFWPGPDDQMIFLAKLRGKGVNSGNDCALYLKQDDGRLFRLMREGDPYSASGYTAIRTIDRVDVDSENGHYVVLASLASESKTNLAILSGNTSLGDDTDAQLLRLPAIRLRKGTYYQARPGSAARIVGLQLSSNTTDAS